MEVHFNNLDEFLAQQQAAVRQNMIDEEMCNMCKHTYLIND